MRKIFRIHNTTILAQSPLNTHLSSFHWNRVGGPKSSEALVITDLVQTGDLTPEEQLSTCCKHYGISGHNVNMCMQCELDENISKMIVKTSSSI